MMRVLTLFRNPGEMLMVKQSTVKVFVSQLLSLTACLGPAEHYQAHDGSHADFDVYARKLGQPPYTKSDSNAVLATVHSGRFPMHIYAERRLF